MTIKDLKERAYDLLVLVNRAQQELEQVQREIALLSQKKEEPKEEPKVESK